MNLPDGLLDASWVLAAWLLFAPLAGLALRQAPWRVLTDSARLNAFLGMVVALVLLWQLAAGVRPGLSLHLLGATVLTLCFGWALSFVGLCLTLIGVSLNGAAGWQSFAANALLMAGVGVGVSHALHQLIQRTLPRHLFIYIFGNGFFVSAVAMMAVGGASSLVFGACGLYRGEYLLNEYLPYALLLAFSEAWLSGMLTTLLVVYRPGLLTSFEDDCYLGKP